MKYPILYQRLYPVLSRVLLADFKTAEKKFLDQGINKEEIKKSFEEFKTLKPKIKEVEKKDIDLWAQGDFKDFKLFLNSLKETKSKNEIRKISAIEGAKLIAENSNWWVYRITTHAASRKYGSIDNEIDSKNWCISAPSSTAWDTYSATSNFYFIISKQERDDLFNKIAYQIDNTDGDVYWDQENHSLDFLPAQLKIPKFEVEVPDFKIEINGDLYTLEEFANAKNLTVEGVLDLSNTPITELPPGLKVEGDLDLYGTRITELPPGLKVEGDLDLYGTRITELPPGLTVVGSLNLRDTRITKLPPGLKVGGSLYLSNTPITEIPSDLKAKEIWADEGQIKVNPNKIRIFIY